MKIGETNYSSANYARFQDGWHIFLAKQRIMAHPHNAKFKRHYGKMIHYYKGHRKLMGRLIDRSNKMQKTTNKSVSSMPMDNADDYSKHYDAAWNKAGGTRKGAQKGVVHAMSYAPKVPKTKEAHNEKSSKPETQHEKDVRSADKRFSHSEGPADIEGDDWGKIQDLKDKHPKTASGKDHKANQLRYLNFEKNQMSKLDHKGEKFDKKHYGSGIQAIENEITSNDHNPYKHARKFVPGIKDAYRRKYHLGKYAKSNQKSDDNSKDKSAKESVHDDKSTSKKPQDRKRKTMQSNVAKNGQQASAGSNASNSGNSQSAKSASSQASVAKSQSSKASSAQSSQAKSQSSATKSRASSQSSMAKSQSSKASSAQSSQARSQSSATKSRASSQSSMAKSQSSKASSAQSSQVKSQSSATKSRASSQSSMAKSQSSRAKSTSSSQARSQSSAAKSSTASSHSAARSASRSQSTASKAQVSASQKATSASKVSASKLAKSNQPASYQAKQSAKPNDKNVSQSASHENSNKQSAKSKSQASGKSEPTSQKSSASQIHKNSSAKPAARKASPAQKREKKAAKNPYISKPSAVHHYKKAAVAGATGAGAVRARKLHDIKHYRGELANKRDYGRGHFKTQGAYQSYVKKNASHYAVSPKSGQIVPKNLTQRQQSGIRKKMLADQHSLGLGQNRPQTQQSAPETHTNPFVNKGAGATVQPSNNGASAQHSNPFVNKSVQQQAPSGQASQNQPQDQQNPAMRQFDANHPLAGRFIQRMQQDFGEGNTVGDQVQQAQQDAGMQNQNSPVSQFGQHAAQAGRTAAQTAQNVGHQAVQQPAAHALGQQATQAATGLAQNRPQASQNPGLANALQRGLSQDRNNVAAQNNPQAGQGLGAMHTSSPQSQQPAQQSTPQEPQQSSQQPSAASQAPAQSSNQTAQLGGNDLIHSQIAQSQTAAQQQPSGPQQGGSQQSGPQV